MKILKCQVVLQVLKLLLIFNKINVDFIPPANYLKYLINFQKHLYVYRKSVYTIYISLLYYVYGFASVKQQFPL